MGCADPPSKGSVHPIIVLELTINEVVGGSSDVTGPSPLPHVLPTPLFFIFEYTQENKPSIKRSAAASVPAIRLMVCLVF